MGSHLRLGSCGRANPEPWDLGPLPKSWICSEHSLPFEKRIIALTCVIIDGYLKMKQCGLQTDLKPVCSVSQRILERKGMIRQAVGKNRLIAEAVPQNSCCAATLFNLTIFFQILKSWCYPVQTAFWISNIKQGCDGVHLWRLGREWVCN